MIVKGRHEEKMQKIPKRIAMIGHKYIPSRDGGVEVVVSNLAPHLTEIGYDVTCYNRTNQEFKKMRKSAPLPREHRGVHLVWTPTVDRRGLAAMSSSIIATVMASFRRFDLVHFHTEGPCVICWLPRLLGKKVVVTIHGLDHQRQKWGKFASAYIMLGEKMAVRYAHSIIVLSKGVQAYFREKYGRETVLIPNGIDPAENRPAAEITKQFGLSGRDYILFLGRLVPEKGIHYLIEAYRRLSTDKKLVIVGGTSDTDDYVKHLHELIRARKEGWNAAVGFVIQMEGVRNVLPNRQTHPEFADALALARQEGVEVRGYLCRILPDEVKIVEQTII